ncbi:MAG: hypothetical protein WCP16_08050 [Pseudanabaena sp. ELA645]|jgi:hypothetical protein
MQKTILQKLSALATSVGFLCVITPSAFAVSPVSINQDANVPWSSAIENPFDGKLVYDKHFEDSFAFVTSWSKQGIKATYTEYWSEVVGYRQVWKTRRVRYHNNHRGQYRNYDHYIDERYPIQEPIYDRRSRSKSPKSLMFAINGEIYTYTSGEVDRQLAEALANAPTGTMTVRVVWDNDSTSDFPIGGGTVEAWKSVFQAKPQRSRFANQ